LETRDCPSSITLNVAYGAGRTVTLYGQVTTGNCTPGLTGSPLGPGVAGAGVAIWGAAKGSVSTDANGNFSLTTQASSLGEVDAATTDGQSNTAKVPLSAGPPLISGFAAWEEGSTNYWDIVGHVTDGNFSAAGLSVAINGSPVTIYNGGAGLGATVDGFQNFLLVVKLNGTASDNGSIDAVTTDAWGQQSNTALSSIMQP
jgi:hypothetical protein